MTPAAITIEQLRIQRGAKVVIPGLDVEIPAGRITGLLGPSGSGKSTLLRAIVGVQEVLGGTVTVLRQQAGSSGLRREVGYMTQAPSVYADLSAGENLRFFASVLGVGPPEIDNALEIVGLEGEHNRLVDEMSGGQRTRVSLATTLLAKPRLLVLDEPTVGLDPVLRDDLWRTFRELVDDGATLLISSHVMDEAERCDSLLLMRDGELLATGSPAELQERVGARNASEAFVRLIREREQAGPAGGRSHEPPDHDLRRQPRPAPAAPRPAHHRVASGGPGRAFGPGPLCDQRRRRVRSHWGPAARPFPADHDVSGDQHHDAARAHHGHARAADDDADGKARPAGGLRARVWRRRRPAGVARLAPWDSSSSTSTQGIRWRS